MNENNQKEQTARIKTFCAILYETLSNIISNPDNKDVVIEDDSIPPSLKEIISSLQTLLCDQNNEIKSSNDKLTQLNEELKSVTEQKEKLSRDYSTLLEKLSIMKNALQPKLQAEQGELVKLREMVTSLNEENESLNTQVDRLSRLKDEVESKDEQIDKLNRELTKLKEFVLESQEEQTQDSLNQENKINEYKLQIQQLETKLEEWKDITTHEREDNKRVLEKLNDLQQETETLREESENNKLEAQRQAMSANNLQIVLEQFQAAKEADIQNALEAMKTKLDSTMTELEEYRRKMKDVEGKLGNTSSLNVSQMQKELEEKNELIGKLRRNVIQYETHLAETMRHIKALSDKSESNVDRRLITNLFVSYLNAPRGDKKRYEILQLISNILHWTDEEKYKAGLIKKPGKFLGIFSGGNQQEQEPTSDMSFGDMWISFLMKEANEGDTNNSFLRRGSTVSNTSNSENNSTSPSALLNTPKQKTPRSSFNGLGGILNSPSTSNPPSAK